jgi:hypothetical protein
VGLWWAKAKLADWWRSVGNSSKHHEVVEGVAPERTALNGDDVAE